MSYIQILIEINQLFEENERYAELWAKETSLLLYGESVDSSSENSE